LLLAVRNSASGNYSAVFGGADNEASNTARLLPGGIATLPVVCTHPWSAACVMKPPILPQLLLAVCATLVAVTLLFRRQIIGANNTAAVATGVNNSASGVLSSVVGDCVMKQY
jgi:hypothetical protein